MQFPDNFRVRFCNHLRPCKRCFSQHDLQKTGKNLFVLDFCGLKFPLFCWNYWQKNCSIFAILDAFLIKVTFYHISMIVKKTLSCIYLDACEFQLIFKTSIGWLHRIL
jgi:hypothetical protein